MKHILSIILITFSFLNCKAQTPILSLETDSKIGAQENSYYKDLNNVLNTFEGTWLYTNGNTSLKIVLVKLEMCYGYNSGFYQDLMVGGYQYIEDGVEKINTLSDANHPTICFHASIRGNNIYDDCSYLPVDDCVDGEKRLDLSIEDTTTGEHFGDLILHKRTVNGQEALKGIIEMNFYGDDPQEGDLPDPTLPWQMHDFILIKQ